MTITWYNDTYITWVLCDIPGFMQFSCSSPSWPAPFGSHAVLVGQQMHKHSLQWRMLTIQVSTQFKGGDNQSTCLLIPFDPYTHTYQYSVKLTMQYLWWCCQCKNLVLHVPIARPQCHKNLSCHRQAPGTLANSACSLAVKSMSRTSTGPSCTLNVAALRGWGWALPVNMLHRAAAHYILYIYIL